MKTSLSFYAIWKKIPRLFPRYSRYISNPISAQYEAVSQGQDQLPEYFNFASDVLDKWTQIEKLTAKDIKYRLQTSGAKCLITTEALGSVVDSIAPQCPSMKTKLLVSSEGKREGWLNFDELLREASASHTCAKTRMNDPMLVYFTSGTTGAPKMVEHTQGSLGFRPIISQRSWLYTTPSDIVWGTADTSWVVAALGAFFDPWVLGSCVFIHNLPMLEKTTILKTFSQFPITAFVSPPTFFRMFLGDDFTSGSYMADCVLLKCSHQDVPQKTAATERGDFFCTGDRGVMDEDGYFRFIGRADDIIKSSGYRIGPFEVESVLLKHPAVAEVAVVVKAFVVLSTGYSTHSKEKLTMELQEHVKKMTAPYKYPRKVEFVQQLPKSATGKIRRNELRDQEWGRV
ncbi:hypothetical protein Chor_015214 [Crotalus horridus]